MPSTPARTSRSHVEGRAVTTGILILAVPSMGAMAVLCELYLGWLGTVLPLALVLTILYLYRATTRSTHSHQTRAAAREVGAATLALALGVGTWMSALMVGFWLGLLPLFDTFAEDYPHQLAWVIASTLLAVASVPASWWLLRRFADDPLGDGS